jgi:hypothetical protein
MVCPVYLFWKTVSLNNSLSFLSEDLALNPKPSHFVVERIYSLSIFNQALHFMKALLIEK